MSPPNPIVCVWCVFLAGYTVECRDISGYTVEKRKKGRTDWQPCNADITADTEFKVNNLPEGSVFEFRVVANNDGGPGKPSKSTGSHVVKDPVCKYI